VSEGCPAIARRATAGFLNEQYLASARRALSQSIDQALTSAHAVHRGDVIEKD
jgi:hypothetical protein